MTINQAKNREFGGVIVLWEATWILIAEICATPSHARRDGPVWWCKRMLLEISVSKSAVFKDTEGTGLTIDKHREACRSPECIDSKVGSAALTIRSFVSFGVHFIAR